MSDYVTTDTFEEDFRCLLIRLVGELGAEKFSSFCFILSVPEPVRERHRADVLQHLLEQGKISPRRPHEFVRLLRDKLQRDDLATQAETVIEGLLMESRPIQETVLQDTQLQDVQPIAVRELRPQQKRQFNTARRHGVCFESTSDDDEPGSQQNASMWPYSREPLEEEPQQVGSEVSDPKEDSGFHDSYSPNTTLARDFWKYAHSEAARKSWGEQTLKGMLSDFLQKNKAERLLSEESVDFAGHQRISRSASNASNASGRSSGYYSMRNSMAEGEPLVSEPTASLEQSQSHTRSTALSPISESCSSRQSSRDDDSPDDDFHSCTSFESQSSEDPCSHHSEEDTPLQTHGEAQVSLATPSVASSPILGEMRLKRKDVVKHIGKKKQYSCDSFPLEQKAYQFALRLYPTNYQQDGSALYIDVTRGLTVLAHLLPMKVQVCVCATDACKASQSEKKSCISSVEKIVDSLHHYQSDYQCCFASFPKVVSHEQLSVVKSDFITVQVAITHADR